MSGHAYKGNTSSAIQALDFLLSLAGLIILAPLIITIMLLVAIIDRHPPLFFQTRIGRHQKPFKIIKIRTMVPHTPYLPTHLTNSSHITTLGHFLRKYKLDELPQLINVIKGDMSLVGPRPSIEKETAIIKLRKKKGVYNFKPGITGLAAIKKVDMSMPRYVVKLDELTMKNLNPCFYIVLIFLTLIGKGSHDPAHAKHL